MKLVEKLEKERKLQS